MRRLFEKFDQVGPPFSPIHRSFRSSTHPSTHSFAHPPIHQRNPNTTSSTHPPTHPPTPQDRPLWQTATTNLALLDVLLSLAEVSAGPGYCRPTLVPYDDPATKPFISIKGGRHPCLEARANGVRTHSPTHPPTLLFHTSSQTPFHPPTHPPTHPKTRTTSPTTWTWACPPPAPSA